MPVQTLPWGKTDSGKSINRFILTNINGISAEVINYGGILTEMNMPDKNGMIDNLCLGYPDLESYENDSFFIGATVGRFANRIAKGKFILNGKTYTLPINNEPNHLHGGPAGYYKKVWKAKSFEESGSTGVILNYLSEDGDAEYPGNLKIKVIYRLTDENELRIDYEATTDQATPVNLTNHAYWNLSGTGSIKNHLLKLFASRYLPMDDTAIPTGEMAEVQGTPLDFTTPKIIEKDLANVEGGFDHCFVIDSSDEALAPAAVLKDPDSGRVMEVFTTKPGIQFYSGNFLAGPFVKHGALCLETQFFPDSPNQPDFPSCILNPGETYQHTTVHRFVVEKK